MHALSADGASNGLRQTLQVYQSGATISGRGCVCRSRAILEVRGLGLSSQLAAQLASAKWSGCGVSQQHDVNSIYPYERLKAPNVLGTQEILRLATRIDSAPACASGQVVACMPATWDVQSRLHPFLEPMR